MGDRILIRENPFPDVALLLEGRDNCLVL